MAMINRTASFLAAVALFGVIGLTVTPLPAQTPLIGQAEAIDGDTIRIGDTRVRLWGIDAPEAQQPCLDAAGHQWACGEAATAAMRKLLAEGDGVECIPTGQDRYGRVVADCVAHSCIRTAGESPICAPRHYLASRMVALGLALDYPKYSHGAYKAEQDAAQSAKLGMWAGTFAPPWDWRHDRK